MNKITFKLETDFDLELDFILIGISSSLRDYRLCHFINKYTGLKFIYGKEDPIDHNNNLKNKSQEELDYHIIYEKSKSKKKDNIHHFPTYRYCNDSFEYEFYIMNNKSIENGFLVPEAANFDYFLIIKHFIDEEDLEKLIDNLKKVKDILLAKEIDPITLKSKENLIF
ncbi:IPExxxVDY family protein [Sphingobacterium alkalisoli]|uniref:IPExxxVDY family protein n=1 Tax=Sphingobacterium alkalisoli TaxID=1874115 RepID=A0A4U0H931_9SPHI|nr:IPExxxVDY family protein [Sphingobacterium alkalisoli]TJY68286.1 IPExxxVDY family protein [Sphingobacterium alkalisoli]